MTTGRGKIGDANGAAQAVVVCEHPSRFSLAALRNEGPDNGSGLWYRGSWQTKFARGDDAALLATAKAVAQVDGPTIRADERPYDVTMQAIAAALPGVKHPCSRLVFEAKFALEMTQKRADNIGPIEADRWVDVDMPDWLACPTVSGARDKLAKLPRQIWSSDMASGDLANDLTGLR